jgi:YHS domain-containing protein
MKKLLMGGAMLVLATAAFAGPPKADKTKPAAAKSEVECAVMAGHKVNIKEATGKKAFADYKGRRYFFCCAGCEPAFKKEPAKYASNEKSIPTPKAGKPAKPAKKA